MAEEVKIKVKLDSDQAKRDTKELRSTMSSSFKKMETSTAGLVKALGGLAVLTKLTGFVKESVNAFDKQAKAEAALAHQLGRTSKALLDQASALQQSTLYGDEATIQAQAQIAVFTKNEETIARLTPAIQDMATTLKMDLNSASQLVGKTLGSSTNALARYGIEVEGAANSSERAESIIGALTKKFEGASSAALAGAGNIEQAKNAFGDLQEVIGELVLPTVNEFAKAIKEASEFYIDLLSTTEKYEKGLTQTQIQETNKRIDKIRETIKLQEMMYYTAVKSGDASQFRHKARLDELRAEEKAAMDTFTQLSKNARAEQKIDKQREDAKQKELEKTKAISEKKGEIQQQEIERLEGFEAHRARLRKERQEAIEQSKESELERQEERNDRMYDMEQSFNSKLLDAQISNNEKQIAEEERLAEKRERIKRSLLTASMSISRSAFDIAETMFGKNKGLALSEAGINTSLGVTKALASAPPPVNFVNAAAVGAAGAAEIATILAAADGADFIAKKPTMMMVGEAGPESVKVEPAPKNGEASENMGQVNNINITVNGNADQSTVSAIGEAVKEAVRNRDIRLGVDSQGMVGVV